MAEEDIALAAGAISWRLSPRVTGGRAPVADVIVALEARVGRPWVNFRTLRSGPDGVFEMLYRFTRTGRPTDLPLPGADRLAEGQ